MEAQTYQRYSFGPFLLDPVEKVLLRQGQPVPLPPKALETLLVLVENHGHLVDKADLLERVWPDTFVEEATLAQNIFTLRKALNGSAGGSQYIETVPKRGYRFMADVELLEPPESRAAARTNLSRALGKPRALFWAIGAFVVLILAAGIYLRSRSRSAAAEGGGDRLTLAVLPFENFTGDAAQEYLSEGLTEEMIAQLSRMNPDRLRVIARTTSMQYKGTHKTIAQIRRELAVNYVLESSFRREGSRARITTQLVRTSDQTHVWSQEYERDINEILPLETEVAQSIAREIAVKLSPEAEARLTAKPAVNPQAHQLYLQGRYFWNKRSEQGYLKAIDYFNQAIGVDPRYAQAYSGLADAYALLGSNPTTTTTRAEAMSKARAAAAQALAIDDSLAEAHTSLAFVHWHYDWNWPAAEKEFQRALQLDPSYPTAHHWYAYYLLSQGRKDEALEEIYRAQEIDPLSLVISADRAEVLCFARRYEDAIAQAKRALEMDPEFVFARRTLVWSYLAQHRDEEALEEAKKAVREPGAALDADATLAITYAVAGQKAQARELLAKFKRESERQPSSQLSSAIANVYVALGDKDQGFVWLGKVLQDRDGGLTLIEMVPYLESVHDDPRFAELIRRIGLPR